MLKNRHVLNVTSGTGQLMEQNYTYYPKSVKVDNYSGHWLRVDPDGLFVPPFTAGMLIDLFVQSQQIRIMKARPPGISLTSTANELDGTAIVSVYDTGVFPFPGTDINPPSMQRIPAIGSDAGSGDILPAIPGSYVRIGLGYSFPLHWSAADNNENNEHIQARQLIDVQDAQQTCAAGVQTTIAGITPDVNWQRITFATIGTDTSGDLLIDYSSGSFPIFHSYIMAGYPVVIPFYPNGFFLNGSGASRFRATHSVGGEVYLHVGMAHS